MVLAENGVAEDTNLFKNKSFIYIAMKNSATQLLMYWENKHIIHWSEYQIKESDMRTKTATFTSPNYFDLTTGIYCVLISSPFHENFAGIIISVDYDEDNGLYKYKCQDFSRNYQSKFELVDDVCTNYQKIMGLLTRMSIPMTKANSKYRKKSEWKNVLSGLRPLAMYDQSFWENGLKFNPMKNTDRMIIRDKSYMEAIRDIIFGSGAYIDIYFDDTGVMQIEPFSKKDWLSGGLWLTTKEVAERQFTFDTTNVITGVIVNGDKTSGGVGLGSADLLNLNLSVFFGSLNTSISNPNKDNTSKTSSKTSTTKKASKTPANPYGTKKKTVYLNTDSISGYSTDMRRMKDMAKILKKNGWNVVITGVGSEAHWKRRGEVKKGIWFCLYGGACAGTLKEHCTSSWFLNPLKKNKSRVVVGFFPPASSIKKGGKYYKYLVRAHDDHFSPSSFHGISYPAKFLSKAGVPFMYADNAKQMVTKFLAGGDNYTTDGKNYKYHDSWRKHNVSWIK